MRDRACRMQNYLSFGWMMKSSLTSLEVYFLVGELKRVLNSVRVDKVYQVSERELKIRFRVPGEGSSDIIVAPNYLCITKYPRDVPEQPSSFAMQLRKHLKGSVISDVRQHEFDRIVEFGLERQGQSYNLIVELFSKGNVILCDSEGMILGLLEWQKWRDRRLGVGRRYEYPPTGQNPLEIDIRGFLGILKGSEKSLASTLATDVGLGGLYSEEVCLRSGINKEKGSDKLLDEEVGLLFEGLQRFLKFVKKNELDPQIILDEAGEFIDVIPFPLRVYEGFRGQAFPTLNDAVDTYFSQGAFIKRGEREERDIQDRIQKIGDIKEKQMKTIQELERKAREYREIGDFIYQNIHVLDKVLDVVGAERKRGATWSEIREKAAGKTFNGITFVDVDQNGSITLEVKASEVKASEV